MFYSVFIQAAFLIPLIFDLLIAWTHLTIDDSHVQPVSAVCGRETVRCVTESQPNQWMQIKVCFLV